MDMCLTLCIQLYNRSLSKNFREEDAKIFNVLLLSEIYLGELDQITHQVAQNVKDIT